jgi:transcriptional regulator with XRE-family HTH domain
MRRREGWQQNGSGSPSVAAVGFNQEALAALLDVERSTVVRWESGEAHPLPRPMLAQTLCISADQLDGLAEDHARIIAGNRA